jgi:hypothetical protein
MRLKALTLAALLLVSCRPYDLYTPLADQGGLLPADRFARLGSEQAQLVAAGRSLAAWRMTADPAEKLEQARRAKCFAERLPAARTVTADAQGNRLTIQFRSGWRAATVPIADGTEPAGTPGLPPLSASSCG